VTGPRAGVRGVSTRFLARLPAWAGISRARGTAVAVVEVCARSRRLHERSEHRERHLPADLVVGGPEAGRQLVDRLAHPCAVPAQEGHDQRRPAAQGVVVATPLQVEIIVHAPTLFYHCQHCEFVWQQIGFSKGVRAEQLRSGLPEDLQREYAAISDWAQRLLATYRDHISVQVIDATSIAGLWRSLRFGVHRLPAILVEGRTKFVGADVSSADAFVARCLGVARG
jgi:hypothetical protein